MCPPSSLRSQAAFSRTRWPVLRSLGRVRASDSGGAASGHLDSIRTRSLGRDGAGTEVRFPRGSGIGCIRWPTLESWFQSTAGSDSNADSNPGSKAQHRVDDSVRRVQPPDSEEHSRTRHGRPTIGLRISGAPACCLVPAGLRRARPDRAGQMPATAASVRRMVSCDTPTDRARERMLSPSLRRMTRSASCCGVMARERPRPGRR